MIDFNAEIISGYSMGNVVLGRNISEYIDELYSRHRAQLKEYSVPDDEVRSAYTLDGTMTIVVDSNGLIASIGCNQNYTGRYRERLYAGQSMRDIIGLTSRQRIFNGSLIIDDDFGFSFVIPSPYDEIADAMEHMPLDLIFNEIYVADFSSWNPRNSGARFLHERKTKKRI
ncbi:hypothetical protein RJP21_27540 [Paenibacillus sp. VCA1]|uniref:hypothetical protein n=1 Tax=Paenibacillus sp. VCA1 TaxID=3039148 RepID=UPI00287133AC|nr:hypothetical protein [Paenibacillus sp. VCA1]MDR9857353.1 hypothetical protein [Paenibacillus sp. VCA1]